MNDAQRRQFEKLRADRRLIEQAATCIRHEAFQGQYAGFHRKELAIGMAAVLDMIALQLRDVPDGVRTEAVSVAAGICAMAPSPGGTSGGST